MNEEKIGINDRLKASAWKELGKLPFDFDKSKHITLSFLLTALILTYYALEHITF